MTEVRQFLGDDKLFFTVSRKAWQAEDYSTIQAWRDELEKIIISPETSRDLKNIAKSRYNDLSVRWEHWK
jgi:hypothetical protein